jgi:hypothetical protein
MVQYVAHANEAKRHTPLLEHGFEGQRIGASFDGGDNRRLLVVYHDITPRSIGVLPN